MKREVFFDELAKIFEEANIKISEDTVLEQLKEYDSMGILSLVAFIDETFGLQCTARELAETKNVKDLMVLIGYDKFE